VLKQTLLTAVSLLVAAAPASASLQSSPDSAWNRRREFPLNCRGGERLVFDTLGRVADTAPSVQLSLTFTASRQPAGWKGEGLEPSTCAWVDRPLNGAEPRQVRFAYALRDSAPRLTLRDTSLYWSFLAYNTDNGHFHGVGYRHWQATSTPPIVVGPPPAGRFLFALRHLPLYTVAPMLIVGWTLIVGIPSLTFLGMWSGWRRLAALYPSGLVREGRLFRCGFLIMRITWYRSGTRLTAGDSHLHFSVVPPFRPGHPPFSVPWADVTVSRDGWPWLPFKGRPVMRLTLARDRGIRILVPVSVGEGIIAASGGRLQLTEPRIAAAATR
jgi:hypothetical protein